MAGDIEKMQKRIENLEQVLTTTIAWIAQSGTTVIGVAEAQKLIGTIAHEKERD